MKPGRPDILLAGFVAALAALGVLAWLNWRYAARSLETAEWVAHTHLVQAGLNRLESLVKDIESGARGYVLTGDRNFLSSFEGSLRSIREQQSGLEQVIHDNQAQTARLSALESLIAKRVELSRRTVELRQHAGFEAARAAVSQGTGKEVMDAVDAEFSEMDLAEQALLDERTLLAQREASVARRLTLAGTTMSFALLIAVFSLVVRENRLRRRSEEELERFFTLSLDMLCISSADGHFKRISPAFTWTLGWSAEEILARPFLDLVHPDDADATVREVERQVVAGANVLQFENRYLHKDGSWRVLSWNSVPEVGGLMYATARDVTERRRAEEDISRLNAELRAQTARLESANKELESFAYSVSHDLRAPLRGMDGFSQALLEDYAGQLDATGRDYLGRIRAASQRMGQLIDDLLDLSQVTRSAMTWEPVNLAALARKAIAELQSQHQGRVVEWEVSDPLTARGDPRLLQLALQNLLANALKFTGKCEHARIEFGQAAQGAEQVFFVRDNGAGFDMAHANRLFGAFQRLHSALEFPGTGIGLATVQRIIHRHGGRVWAEAKPGKGATFSFTLETAK